jgi:hypothetical protein
MTRPLNEKVARHVGALVSALLLSACASKPAPPDWQANAFAALKGFSSAYLNGNTRLADFEFARARTEISSTGRADLLARAELTRCATRVASLEFDHCAGYQPLAADAAAAEQAYAAYLTGQWTGLNTTLLPAQHRAMAVKAMADPPAGSAVSAGGPVPASSVLGAMEDPLARLVAAGVLLQSSRLTPADIGVATETASARGWRRPLLAWLGVQLKRTQDAGDQDAAKRLQRRIDLVLQSAAPQLSAPVP